MQLREVGIKHRNRANALQKKIEQNKTEGSEKDAEIAELKRKLEEAPATSESTSSATATELADKTKVWALLACMCMCVVTSGQNVGVTSASCILEPVV